MPWTIFLPVLIEVMKGQLGPLAGKLLEKLFGGKVPPGTALPAAALETPTGLKEFLQKLLQDNIAKLSWLPPSLKDVLQQISVRLDGLLLDLIWNALFNRKLVSSGSPPRAAQGETVEPLTIPPEAPGAFFSVFGENVEEVS